MRRIISEEQDKLLLKIVDEAFVYIDKHPKCASNIIYIPSYYQLDYARLFDLIMAIALKLRGARLIPVLTDSGFCQEFYYGGNYNLSNLSGPMHHNMECHVWMNVLRTNPIYIFDNECKEEKTEAHDIASSVEFANYKDISYEGYEVGRQAANLVANFNNMPFIVSDPIIMDQVRLHVEYIVRLIISYKKIFRDTIPDAVLSNVPFYYKWGTAYHVAASLNIPFYGFQLCDRKNTWMFASNTDMMHDVSAAWPSFKKKMYSKDVLVRIEDLIKSKLSGETEHHYYYQKPEQHSEDYKQYLRWRDNSKPLAIFPVNILFDAVAYQKSLCYENIYEMILDVIKFFNRHQEFQLVIKAHPAEAIFVCANKPEFVKYRLTNLLKNEKITLEKNIHYLDCDVKIALSDLFSDISLGLVQSSTSALEMAMHGKPVISLAQTQYSGKEFIYEPKSKDEFYSLIEYFMKNGLQQEERTRISESARLYMLLSYYHAKVDFNLFEGADNNSVPTKILFDSAQSLLPGSNTALDYICDSIINKLPIFAENRWPPYTGEHPELFERPNVSIDSERIVKLAGFDPDGEVFMRGDQVFRGIFAGRGTNAKTIFQLCQNNNLFKEGIVNTIIPDQKQFGSMGYDLVFAHSKVPFISYAYEWTPSMMKDAAVFQLDLTSKLLDSGLVLKDCGVTTNVLFDGPKPVHVDFLSIIQKTKLTDEEWLRPAPIDQQRYRSLSQSSQFFYAIFNRMFFPCVLFPLYLYHQNKDAVVRKRLQETALNTTLDIITEQETFNPTNGALHSDFNEFRRLKESFLCSENWRQFLAIQKQEILRLNVARTKSGYSDYYESKGENFDFMPSAEWKPKHKSVYWALTTLKPATVLDLGANTGWFSILAARQGAKVVAIDNDTASMDILYRRAKQDNLSILPLVMDFLNPSPDIAAMDELRNDPHLLQSKFKDESPLLLSADRRLACDMVMSLALIHHLCLGAGRHIEDVIVQFSRYSKNHLVLEFVTKEDPLVTGEPTFFTAHYKNPELFTWYTREHCLAALKKHYGTINEIKLTPTRFLFVCTHKIKGESWKENPFPQELSVQNKPAERPVQAGQKILFTTPILEHPPAGGPALRIENTIKALNEICELHIAVRTSRTAIGGAAAEEFYGRHSCNFFYTPRQTGSSNENDELVNAKALVTYAVDHGIHIIWCGFGNISYHLMKAIKSLNSELKVICDTDSVWSRFVLRELSVEKDSARCKAIEKEGRAKEREEAEWVNFCDITTAVSEVDAEYYRRLSTDPSRVQIFSNVIDLKSYMDRPSRAPDMHSPSMYLAGSFYSETSPMARAARWVISEVFPMVRSVIPDIKLFCIGSGADRILADIHHPDVIIKGKVPSVLPYLCYADVALVPLMYESGTRFKIMEAGACKIPIVSTTLGAEGIPVTHGKDIILADDPVNFARGIIALLKNKDFSNSLSANGYVLIEKKFSIESLKNEAAAILKKLKEKEKHNDSMCNKISGRAIYKNEKGVVAADSAEPIEVDGPFNYGDEYSNYICEMPFTYIELGSNDRVTFCCYLKDSIGRFSEDNDLMKVWNSPIARKIRKSMLEGSFSYCDKNKCAKMQRYDLYKRNDKTDPYLYGLIQSETDNLPNGPHIIALSNDPTCNLACPSCRKTPYVMTSGEYDRISKVQEKILRQAGKDIKVLHVSGSGDPFASRLHFQLLQNLNPVEFPNLKIRIMTNGLLLRDCWEKIKKIHDCIEIIGVSVDAATEETYKQVRKGGDFQKLLSNLHFIASLPQRKRGLKFKIGMIVQKKNYKEMKSFVELGKKTGADLVTFSKMSNWGTFSEKEYLEQAVFLDGHPEHEQFLELLRDPIFSDEKVNMGNLNALYLGNRMKPATIFVAQRQS